MELSYEKNSTEAGAARKPARAWLIQQDKLLTEDQIQKRIARILRAVRKNVGLNQSSVGDLLGLNQSAFSRIEAGVQFLTASQWYHFCREFALSPEALSTGFFESPKSRQPLDMPSLRMRLPRRYREHAYSRVRSLQPMLRRFSEKFGEEKLEEFLRSCKLDPDYFLDLDNEINFNFTIDLSKALVSRKAVTLKSLGSVTQLSRRGDLHGALHCQYAFASEQGVLPLLQALAFNSSQYGRNFEFQLSSSSQKRFQVEVKAQPHMQEFAYVGDSVLQDFFCLYNQSYLSEFLEPALGAPAQVKVLENQYRKAGSGKCVYQIQI